MITRSATLLYDWISENYDGTDYLGLLQSSITCQLFEPKIIQLENIEAEIRMAHQAPCVFGEPPTPKPAIKYNRRIYFSCTGFESTVDLKPEYTQQMDAWIESCNELMDLIYTTIEYMHDLFATAVCIQNFQKLMPAFMYSEFLKQLDQPLVSRAAFFDTKPDLTDKDIAAFQDKYADLISELKVIYLDKLTGASCPSEQKILLI